MFELRQLRCFVAAADELHFGRAARRLNMTQPPLSRQIQLLEHALGVRLFERSSRNVALTSAGRVFLLEARRILRLSESAALATRRVASGEAGTITIGFTAASGYSYLPRLITLCRARLPNITIQLKEMVSGDQIEALLSGRIDMGLLRPPIDRVEFATLRVLVEPLVAALPSGDARVAKAVLALDDFHQQPFIMYAHEGAKYFFDMLNLMFESAQVVPTVVQNLSQIHSMLGLVRAGIGAAVVPEAATSLHLEDVAFRPLGTTPANPVELFAVWRTDNDNPALRPLVAMLENELGRA
ncbi:LysR substrate-binding domain-containing protein [Sphingomonas crusticola]|uniref:LysR substrate-binding domain-containing protein n=1 Tax=Sphingomonas crusticola TaxID=1697973 RepID=UPI000E2821D5|nr:LysR substrate-binding domain-containing protein [Sphingomonas crusticola]